MRALALIGSFTIGLAVLAAMAWAIDEPDPGPPILSTGEVTLVVGAGRQPLRTTITTVGPLFDLAPIAAATGAQLLPGPLGQSWAVDLGGTRGVFGLESRSLALGRRLVTMSQQPRAGDGGSVHVPLDLLVEVLGGVGGLEVRWDESTAVLEVNQRAARDIEVSLDVVDLPGVTTVVVRFDERPRYRFVEREGRLDILVEGDRLVAPAWRGLPPGPYLKRLAVGPAGLALDIAPGTNVSHYELDPRRLVIDLQSAAAADPVAALPASREPWRSVIVLDPGHGGSETGALGPSGAREKELTLLLAQSLARRLEERLGVKVVLTRDGDADLGLDARSAIANQHGAELFVSLHLNAAFGTRATGAETYFLSLEASDARAAAAAAVENQPQSAVATEGEAPDVVDEDLRLILWDLAQTHHLGESQRFARLVQQELDEALGLRDRGVKQAPFRVLMGAGMPAVLVELGFITNPEEEKRLLDPEYRAQLVEALVRAIQRFRSAGDAPTAP